MSIKRLSTSAVVCLWATALFSIAAAEPLLPEETTVAEEFAPGMGRPVGKVLSAQGEAVIMREGASTAYRTEPGLPLYEDDAIVCPAGANLSLLLNDGSRIAVGAASKIVLNRVHYSEIRKERSTFVSQFLGTCRYWVTKFNDYQRSLFRVKTPNTYIGVRGSDFVVIVGPEATQVSTLADTELEVVETASLCTEAGSAGDCGPISHRMQSFQHLIIETGEAVNLRDLRDDERTTIEETLPLVTDNPPMKEIEIRVPLFTAFDGPPPDTAVPSPMPETGPAISERMDEIIEEADRYTIPDYPGQPGVE